jgi:ubiquinone/menaquinone biosynthesis C-methylase UbiE
VADRVTFTGWLPTEADLNEALNAADIGLVLRIGQRWDNFHITDTLVHEMAVGLPIVAANLSGIAEILRQGAQGLLYTSNSIPSFVDAIEQLAQSPSDRINMGRASLGVAQTVCAIDDAARLVADTLRGAILPQHSHPHCSGDHNNFVEHSYRIHEQQYATRGEQPSKLPPWQDLNYKNTVDAWRHQRFFAVLDPFLEADPDATWLTVGDGHYGNDAHYLESKGAHVIASDISTHLLEQAHQAGHIREYRRENAESISLPDNSVDYIFCKHACHHFPRPYMAIYEMLRVCRKAVILEEPTDPYVCRCWTQIPLTHLRRLVNRVVAGRNGKHDYEPVGNYLYKFSEREFEKLALGMGMPTVAFKGLNDFYHPALAKATLKSTSAILEKLLVGTQDLLTYAGILQPVVLVATIFKAEPTEKLRTALKPSQHTVADMPRNQHAP